MYRAVVTAHTGTGAAEPATREDGLRPDEAEKYAAWFAALADPTRVRLLHAVANAAGGTITVGELAERIGVGQPTCSHHVRLLSEVGFLLTARNGRTTQVRVNVACCTGLPHAADVIMGATSTTAAGPVEPPTGVTVRALRPADMPAVLDAYAQGIASRNATFETEVPAAEDLRSRWLPGHAWVAERDGRVVGWTALSPVSARECYRGVAEGAVYVHESARGNGVGRALLRQQVEAADSAGLWTLQTSVFPENRASLALHHGAGYRTLAVRNRIARLDGAWRDTILLERRSAAC